MSKKNKQKVAGEDTEKEKAQRWRTIRTDLKENESGLLATDLSPTRGSFCSRYSGSLLLSL